jgi:hypothetical protein
MLVPIYKSAQHHVSTQKTIVHVFTTEKPYVSHNMELLFTELVTAVSDAVEQMICHFSAAQNQAHLSVLGDSSHTPACAQLALSKLCPALYAVLSDGLHPTLSTAFGSIQNSVWQVVEASAQQGEVLIYITS